MTWIIVISAVVACWAMLRILGGERERQLNNLRMATHAAVPQAKAATHVAAAHGGFAPHKSADKSVSH